LPIEMNGFDDLAKMFEGGLGAPILASMTIPLDCPACGHKIEVNMQEALKSPRVECPACNQGIQLDTMVDDEGSATT
jgi:DNA-directed RNA polymerase subunit RPC12/RpoP